MSEQLEVVSGRITHTFAHRFVVDTKRGPVLADITPKGLEQIELKVGDEVTLEGEMKPSELKVSRLTCRGKTIRVEHKKKHDDKHHPYADPAVVIAAALAAGFEPLGEPRRKPKHFEVLGRRQGKHTELHIELDGHIRKTKPVERHDHKWSELLQTG